MLSVPMPADAPSEASASSTALRRLSAASRRVFHRLSRLSITSLSMDACDASETPERMTMSAASAGMSDFLASSSLSASARKMRMSLSVMNCCAWGDAAMPSASEPHLRVKALTASCPKKVSRLICSATDMVPVATTGVAAVGAAAGAWGCAAAAPCGCGCVASGLVSAACGCSAAGAAVVAGAASGRGAAALGVHSTAPELLLVR